MLTFEMDVVAANVEERTIEGVIVPYDEVGRIAGVDYRFRPGSVRAARSRTPLLLDHDRGRPVGVLASLEDAPNGALGTFRIDRTPDGDQALAQAASGSRGALSVGASVEAADDRGGVLEVTAGLVHEVSLLALGAFAGATVTRVAAEAEEPDDPDPELDPNPDQEELELDPPAPPASTPDPEEGTMHEATEAAPVIIATADRPARELVAGELVALIVRAQHGEPDARRYLEAALVESISTDVSGLLPPTYERTVLGGSTIPRPLYETFRSRPLPGVGLAVNKPVWTTPPDGQWAATVDDDAHSTKIVVGSQQAHVERWDWAGAIPWVVVQRSDPSIVDEIYAEAVLDFYLDVETKIAGLLSLSAAGGAATIGEGIADFFTLTGRNPEVILVAPDVWGSMADAKMLDSTVAGGSVSTASGLSSSFAGISIVASASLAAGSQYLATRRALDARVTDPVRLTANAIGALNVELAVVGEGLFDRDYPDEVVALAAGAVTAGRSRSSKAS
jgi:HK97 family phage prohead protease